MNRIKIMKRFAAALLTLCMLILSVPAASAAETDDQAAPESAFELLSALGVISAEEEHAYADEITRGDFARMVMELAGFKSNGAYTGKQVFSDVPPSDKNAAYIMAARDAGYINGEPGGTFFPNNTITAAEAVKLVVSVLGYGPYAEQTGGYPTGYIKIANRMNLPKGLNVSDDTPMTWGDTLILFENSVNADILDIVETGGYVRMQSTPGKTLLTERFSVYRTEAVIDANEYTALMAPDSDLGENTISAGGVIYDVGDTDAADCLGIRAELYYDKDSKPLPKLLYIRPSSLRNTVVELDAEDIEGLDAKRLKYTDENGNSASLNIAENASLIFNGKMAVLNEEKLKPKSGTVKLISNNGDSVFDVIIVMSYDAYVAASISEPTFSVGTKQGAALTLDPNDSSYFTIIKKDGKTVGFDAIKPNMVLSYAESENTGRIVKTIILSENIINGTIEKINSAEKRVTINGVEYRYVEGLSDRFKPGSEGAFYLDAFGNIVYLDGTLDIVYGYLNGLEQQMFGKVICRIFTENSRWGTLALSGRVMFNGESLQDEEVVKRLGKEPEQYRQLIRYLVNSEGEIIRIDTASPITMGTYEDEAAMENDTFRLSLSGSLSYRSTNQSFNGLVSIGSSAKLFVIPDQSSGSNEEGFLLLHRDSLKQDATYTFEAYDANQYRSSDIFVLKSFTDVINTSSAISNMMLVVSRGQVLNSDKEIVESINGYWQGRELALPVRLGENSQIQSLDMLNPGDIIQFSYKSTGEIDNIERRYEAGEEFSLSSSNPYNAVSFVGGKVLKADTAGSRMVLQYADDGSYSIYSINNTSIYIYERRSKRFTVGSAADLMEGDMVFTSARYLMCSELFILRD